MTRTRSRRTVQAVVVPLLGLAGLLAEVESLVPYRHHQALQTVGYQEIFGYLDGQYDYAEAVRLLQRNTRHYAKRQLTWLRRDAGYEWVEL